MGKIIIEEVEKWLEKSKGKMIEVNQKGFISSEMHIEKMKYKIEYDNISIEDDKTNTYLTVNLNQVYQIDMQSDILIMHVDNDIKITIINITENK